MVLLQLTLQNFTRKFFHSRITEVSLGSFDYIKNFDDYPKQGNPPSLRVKRSPRQILRLFCSAAEQVLSISYTVTLSNKV